jgi:hypothetical protein
MRGYGIGYLLAGGSLMDVIASRIPPVVRARLRRMRWTRRVWDVARARSQAAGSKRLDLSAAQVAMLFHMSAAPPVTGKVCLEIGSGWVLSHALVMHLLGATRVIATDIEPLAHPSVLRQAVRQSNEGIIRDLLAPFGDHAAIRKRLTALREIGTFDVETLGRLGIEYRAPIDLATTPLGEPIDFAYSLSVLELVPTADLRPLLVNLTADLRPGGAMLHAVHLEDNSDFASAPFEFLSESAQTYDRHTQAWRGNRLRASELLRIFSTVPGLNARIVYAWQRLDRPLPSRVAPEITYTDEHDLRTSHVGIYATK